MQKVFASGVNFNDSSAAALVTTSPTINAPVLTGNVGISTTSAQTTLAVLGNVGIGTWTAAGGNFIVNSNGNVGIATAWPGVKLDISGTIRASSFSGNGSGLSSLSYGPGGGVNAIQYHDGTTTAGSETVFSFNGTNVGIGTTNGGKLVDLRGNAYFSGNMGVGTILVSTNALTVLNQNIGIGTWVPQAYFTVQSQNPQITFVDAGLNTMDLSMAAATGDYANYSTSGDVALRASSGRLLLSSAGGSPTKLILGSTSTEYVHFNTNNGNLGIGTVSPASQLVVVGNGVGIGTGKNSYYIKNTAPLGGLIIEGNVGINTYAPINKFQINSVGNTFIIDAQGNVGVSTRYPGNQVDISTQNAMNIVGSAGSSIVLNSNGGVGSSWSVSDNDSDQRISFSYGSNEVMSIINSNPLNLGIGTIVPKNRLAVVGNIGVASSAGSIFQANAASSGGMIVEGNVGLATTTPQTQMSILGNVGIGTWTANGGALIIRGGNVGIGTAVPGAALELVGIGSTSSTSTLILRDSSNALKFKVADNGNIGIGVTPTNSINLTNSTGDNMIRFTNSATGYGSGGYFGQTNSVGSGGDFNIINETSTGSLIIGTNNTTRMVIDANGNIGMGTTLPQARLSVSSTLNTFGAAPTLSSCGTGPSISGNDVAFRITGGTGSVGCTATFNIAKSKTPGCIVSPQYATSTSSYTVSTTALTYTDAALGTNKVDVICFGYD